ncbi:VPA1267 family protein [Pseudomonas sp. CCC2.2]|uniref:VPA1267 family protein n=1 Tax=Pseudomonas sp. CCC2.2 TaxID=3048605 RepID=UPI0034DD8008
MSNGRQVAEHNVAVFTAWVASKSESDFRSIIHRGALSRSVIAQECGFAKSALGQNPRIKTMLGELETKLRACGVLPKSTDNVAVEPPESSVPTSPAESTLQNMNNKQSTTSDLEAKFQRLQGESALQRAEIEELRRQLKQFTSIHEALSSSGRMPR